MYDENPHLSNKEAAENWRGGAQHTQSHQLDASKPPVKIQRVPYAIGCLILSILALQAASTTPHGAASIGFGLMSLVNALATLYIGTLLYKEPNANKTTDGLALAGFILLNACIMLYLNTRSMLTVAF